MPNPNREREVKRLYKQIQRIVKAVEAQKEVAIAIRDNANLYRHHTDEFEDEEDALGILKEVFSDPAYEAYTTLLDLLDDLVRLQKDARKSSYKFRSARELLHPRDAYGGVAHRKDHERYEEWVQEYAIKKLLDVGDYRGHDEDVEPIDDWNDLSDAGYLRVAIQSLADITTQADSTAASVKRLFKKRPDDAAELVEDVVKDQMQEIYEDAEAAVENLDYIRD